MSQADALGRQILDLTAVFVPVSSEKPPHAPLCLNRALRSKASSTFPWSSGQGECVPCRQIGCSMPISCNISLSLSMSVFKKSHPRRASLSINPSCCFHNMEARRAAGVCVSVCSGHVAIWPAAWINRETIISFMHKLKVFGPKATSAAGESLSKTGMLCQAGRRLYSSSLRLVLL